MTTLTGMVPRNNPGSFRQPIDRVFSIKGHGTVVTGTVLSGTVRKDDKLSILPGHRNVRVKHVESHGQEREALVPGQRAALNLIGDVKYLERGLTLTQPDSLLETTRIRIAIKLIHNTKPLKDRQRLRFLIGTDEALGTHPDSLAGKPDMLWKSAAGKAGRCRVGRSLHNPPLFSDGNSRWRNGAGNNHSKTESFGKVLGN